MLLLLFFSQSSNGYQWITNLAITFLKIALSDAKLVIRTAGSQLASALSKFPEGCNSLLDSLAAPILKPQLNDSTTTLTSTGVKSRLRQEVIDCLTVALLEHPKAQLNFEDLIDNVIVSGLSDCKQTVSWLSLLYFVMVKLPSTLIDKVVGILYPPTSFICDSKTNLSIATKVEL